MHIFQSLRFSLLSSFSSLYLFSFLSLCSVILSFPRIHVFISYHLFSRSLSNLVSICLLLHPFPSPSFFVYNLFLSLSLVFFSLFIFTFSILMTAVNYRSSIPHLLFHQSPSISLSTTSHSLLFHLPVSNTLRPTFSIASDLGRIILFLPLSPLNSTSTLPFLTQISCFSFLHHPFPTKQSYFYSQLCVDKRKRRQRESDRKRKIDQLKGSLSMTPNRETGNITDKKKN